jgi:predicted acylesterase/phospholipase RssA
MVPPVPLQFAFQGGGARLALLPVVHAIRDSEAENLIKVTKVAGTSAGAIAAALVAGKADMKVLVTYLREAARKNPEVLRDVFPSIGDIERIGRIGKYRLLFRTGYRNKPIAEEAKFASFLKDCLKKAGIDPNITVGKLQIPCSFVCADIITKKPITVESTDPLVQILVDSSALPFVFRTAGSKFDGGLIDNLPVDYLSAAKEDDGQILGIGFDEDAYTKQVSGAISLAAALLDAAMTTKTRSTKRLLGEAYVLSISSDCRRRHYCR